MFGIQGGASVLTVVLQIGVDILRTLEALTDLLQGAGVRLEDLLGHFDAEVVFNNIDYNPE